MEGTRRFSLFNFNSMYLVWCFTLPVFAFMMALSLVNYFWGPWGPGLDTGVSIPALKAFLRYYEQYFMREFLAIFFNNYMAALVLVYFTPMALALRRVWERWRNKTYAISVPEKIILILFPGIFLARQAVNIAVIISGLAHSIDQNVLVTFVGIVLPHGLPELAAFSVAGAVGMEVTRKLLFSGSYGRLVSNRVLGALMALIAVCAFVEVYFTPKVFAVLMTMIAMK